jgi:hypothetical protein
MKYFIKNISAILAELMLIIGTFLILIVTYNLNLIAFYYLLAIVIIILGLFIAKTRG